MFVMPTEKPLDIENLKISELTVAQFRKVMQECLDANKRGAFDKEIAIAQTNGYSWPGTRVW